MGIRVEVAGVPIALRPGQTFTWSLAYGVKPARSTLETTASAIEEILIQADAIDHGNVGSDVIDQAGSSSKVRRPNKGIAGPLSILFEDDNVGIQDERRVEVKNVYLIAGGGPGKDYNTRTVVLADQRWLWSRKHIERSYNLRRRTGSFRFIGGDKVSIQQQALTADVGYRRTTLYDPEGEARRWTAIEVLHDVMNELCGADGYSIDSSLVYADSIEGLELHDNGEDALRRVLTYIPGARVYIGVDGMAHIANVYDGSDKDAFEDFGPGNAGDWRVVDKSQQRPEGVFVFSTREVELRFDYVEERGATSAVASPTGSIVREPEGQPGREELWLENVIINPLYNLPKPGANSDSKDVYTQGEPIPFDAFWKAVAGVQNEKWDQTRFQPRAEAPVLSHKLVRETILSSANWQGLKEDWASDINNQYSRERLLLMQAIETHWRKTYRILPQWRDKCRRIYNHRVSILNYETGTRGPAAVFTQHISKLTTLGHFQVMQGDLMIQFDNWAEDLSEKDVSPFQINIIDSDMGLFTIQPKLHQFGILESSLVGNVDKEFIPKAAYDNVRSFWNQVNLLDNFKLSVILTVTQDSPNDLRRLHSEWVSRGEIEEYLKTDFGKCLGPPLDVVQTADTARYMWSDKDENPTLIRNAFFGSSYDGEYVDTYPGDMKLNEPEIKSLSLSAAAAAMVPLADVVEGRVMGPLKDVHPTGNLRTVTHVAAMGQNNVATLTTTIKAPPSIPAQSVYALLPEGVRRKVRRLVQE